MMAAVEKVSIALSPEMVAMLKGAVASGEYASASEVVREALREWNLRKPLREAEIERLRKAWRDGVESGPSRSLDFQEIKRRGRERLAQAKQG
jgi:antitoxin ParD1/3/4